MSALQQYALLFGLTVGVVGFVLCVYAIARSTGRPRHEEGKKHVQAEATITGWTQQAFSGLRCIRPRPPLMDDEINANHHGQHHHGRQPIEHGLQHVLRPTNVQACGLRGRNEVGPCR